MYCTVHVKASKSPPFVVNRDRSQDCRHNLHPHVRSREMNATERSSRAAHKAAENPPIEKPCGRCTKHAGSSLTPGAAWRTWRQNQRSAAETTPIRTNQRQSSIAAPLWASMNRSQTLSSTAMRVGKSMTN
ncbi:hypothetical protein CISG_07937 [Coccidioides immitis RMSCC 3703]|uniref:Uncharacterized protein n=1 Tax=Coccidioides immitis RMSCC 3703 TaxID=454286 RepID=A0A0J8R5Z5_COCIT|nr:hypothetical protein CISG_07937 [Coccidioides immitis RMSCC 3703]